MPSEIAMRRPLRLPRRQLLAGDVLRALPDPATLGDVMDHETEILALAPAERVRLRAALCRRVPDPEAWVTIVEQVFEPGRPVRQEPWPPTDAAALIRAARRIAESLGWRPGGEAPPMPHAVLRGLSGVLMRLEPAERRSAAGLLAGLCDWPSGEDLLAWAAADAGAAAEGTEPDEEAQTAAAAAFGALPEPTRRDLAADDPRARWRGAKAAVQAGMPPAALALILKEAGERDPEGMVRRAVAAAGGGRRAG